MVKNEQSGIMNLTNNLQVDPSISEKWDEATTSKFSNIQSMTEANSSGLATIASELDSFVSSWSEKSKDLKALKDGLAAGKLEGDIQGKIASLTAATTDATAKLDTWKEQLGKIKAAIADATNMLSEFQGSNNLR